MIFLTPLRKTNLTTTTKFFNMKVFCIGMFKTGTTTLGAIFEESGFKTFHGPWWGIKNDPFNFDLEKFIENSTKLEPILEEYEAFQDYPFMFIYPYLAEKYPESKFILTERDPVKVAKSDQNMWLALGKKIDEIPKQETFVRRYIDHNNEVKRFFSKSNRLLCIQVGNKEDLLKLHYFLNVVNPHQLDWPIRNKGTYGAIGWLQRKPIYWLLIKFKSQLPLFFKTR